MIEKFNYISDDELEHLINQVEQEELVAAPPDLMESILEAMEGPRVARVSEFRAYCFRVITSVAAAIALVFLLPQLTDRMNLNRMPVAVPVDKNDVVEIIPAQAEVIKTVPDKAMVVAANLIPSKEEVLDDTGFIEKVIISTSDWFNKESNEK